MVPESEPQHKAHLQDVLFKEGANLELLDLAFTPLHINTSQGPFWNLHLLQVLDLSSSHLNTCIQHLFQGLENLRLLDLSQNNCDSGDHAKGQTVPTAIQFRAANFIILWTDSNRLPSISQPQEIMAYWSEPQQTFPFSTGIFSNLKSIYLNFAHNSIHIVPRDKLVSPAGHCVINLSYNPLECTCSAIGLIAWYKQNLDKIEDPKEMRYSEPKSLARTQMATVSLSCGINTAGIIAVVLAILSCGAIFIWGAHYCKQNYQQI